MDRLKKYRFPIFTGLVGSVFLAVLYFGIVSVAESPSHALDLLWEDKLIVIPMILGFGVQVGLYTILKKRLFMPLESVGPSGALTGAGGGMSVTAMVACCAHHVTDVLPIVGLTAATTFLAEYRYAFMILGLGITLAGITIMIGVLYRERRKAIQIQASHMEAI
ncbi:MAG: hypothetical protein GTO18_17895 [Anaerolineales bacterium]|nr:hypothetical protein [Anaerolineales bacterium]